MEEVPDSEKFFPAQLVFLALGFLGPQNQVLNALDIKQDARSNVQTPAKVWPGQGYVSIRCLYKIYRNIQRISKASSQLVTVAAVNL